MRISARCDYACKALLELSLHWSNKNPLPIQKISQAQDIPERYLVQILIQLKSQGLVRSSRGKEGGYNLAKPPENITLGEVMRIMGGPLLPIADSAVKNKSVFASVWCDTEAAMSHVLDKVNFEGICKKVKGGDDVILYQI